jgi:tryptophan synthase alpha chain
MNRLRRQSSAAVRDSWMPSPVPSNFFTRARLPKNHLMLPMTNRIDRTFSRLRERGEKGFIAYFSAGDPTLAATKPLAMALENAGVDIIELGLPFSDPLADGIVNQLAAQRALEAGTTVGGVLDSIRTIRADSQIPIVLYTYMNPLYAVGFQRFHQMAEEAGVDGLLILDLPPDEVGLSDELAVETNLRHIRLIAPTTPPERMASIAANAGGFIYYVSQEGVTGERASLARTLPSQVAWIRKTTNLPISVGFGISTPEQARQVSEIADAVVVGSAIVKKIAEFGTDPDLPERVAAAVSPLVQAVKGWAGPHNL